MIKKLVVAGALGAAMVSFSSPTMAEDFPATPLQHGAPRDLPGENLIPGAQLAVDVINGVTQPILQPILAPGEAAAAPAAAAAAPAAHHRHHPRHHVASHAAKRHHVALRKVKHRTA